MLDLTFAIAEFCFFIAYAMRDVFYLRFAMLIGQTTYILGAVFIAGYEEPGMKAIIVFTSLGWIVNTYRIAIIISERFPILLPDDLRIIYHEVFHEMTVNNFYKGLYELAQKKTYSPGDLLASEGKPMHDLILLTHGSAVIEKAHKAIANLDNNSFVGEMSLLTGGPATATVRVASADTECLVWQKKSLDKLCAKNPELYARLQKAIAVNLVRKLSRHSLLHRVSLGHSAQ